MTTARGRQRLCGLVTCAILGLGALLAPPTAAATAGDPGVERMLAGVDPEAPVPVVVHLRGRAPDAPTTGSRRARRAALVRSLRAHAGSSQSALLARLARLQAEGRTGPATSLWVTDAVAVSATPDVVRELASRPDVASVEPDAVTVLAADVAAEGNVSTTGAPTLWAGGRTGTGVVVATLDSGADPSNPDLAASWRGGTNSWFDPYGQHPDAPVDLSGHGTATLGVVVGDHDAGTSYGMAPGARWIAARVFDDRGASSTSAIHQAFQWALDPDHDPATDDGPDVVNLSWSLGTGPGCDLEFQPDVAALRAAGTLTVAAAGNFGPGPATSVSPGNYPEVLSVGAVDSSDRLWPSSSAGPSTCGGRGRVLPDLVAPGVSVLAADRWGGYQVVSGTSIATPHVAGALALLLQGRRGTAVDPLVAALTGGAVDLGAAGPDDVFGHGRLDVAAAEALLEATPPADPGFALTAAPASVTVAAGQTVSAEVRLVPEPGYDGPVGLAVAGLPSGVTATASPSTLTPASPTATLTLTASRTAVATTVPLTVTGTAAGHTATATLELVVRPVVDFTLSPAAPGVSVRRGASAMVPVSVRGLRGWTGPVAVGSLVLARGVGTSLDARSVTAPGSVTLTVRAGPSAALGRTPVLVTGRVGRVVRSTWVVVTVTR
ncbi:S8 family serine peptidase [Phycicoccus sonneratiae]|uniref:S8 family serine peptidase n=1 Tax=Phycicoccus sonneratiae TaxID=2807628 RepID=A0ABS2CJE6_9MICO|nr:S8 family serine peptidase [Phycicoccus sonneraticus]MBM6400010.1 S8 family serine peptidase [Phycicoccus sonneraticus]